MPSERYTANDDPDRQTFDEIYDRIDEDPARWLDRDLNEDGESLMGTVRPLICGMRDPLRVALWLKVEHSLDRDECPRSRMVEMLEERARYLQETDLSELDAGEDRDPVRHEESITDGWSGADGRYVGSGRIADTDMCGPIPPGWSLPEEMEPVATDPVENSDQGAEDSQTNTLAAALGGESR